MATTCGQFRPGNMKLWEGWEGFPGLTEFSWLDHYSYHGLVNIISACTGVTVTLSLSSHHSLSFNKTTRNINDGMFGGFSSSCWLVAVVVVLFPEFNEKRRVLHSPSAPSHSLPQLSALYVLVVQPLHGVTWTFLISILCLRSHHQHTLNTNISIQCPGCTATRGQVKK